MTQGAGTSSSLTAIAYSNFGERLDARQAKTGYIANLGYLLISQSL